jgi:hypothetical protein
LTIDGVFEEVVHSLRVGILSALGALAIAPAASARVDVQPLPQLSNEMAIDALADGAGGSWLLLIAAPEDGLRSPLPTFQSGHGQVVHMDAAGAVGAHWAVSGATSLDLDASGRPVVGTLTGVERFTTTGTADGSFTVAGGVHGVAVAPDGNYVVTHAQNGARPEVRVYDTSGSLVRSWSFGPTEAKLVPMSAALVAVAADGTIFAAAPPVYGASPVFAFAPDGTPAGELDYNAAAPLAACAGGLNTLDGLDVAPDGHVYVSGGSRHWACVVRFARSGGAWAYDGTYAEALGLCLNTCGSLRHFYGVDASDSAVRIVDWTSRAGAIPVLRSVEVGVPLPSLAPLNGQYTGMDVTLDASKTTVPFGTAARYEWDLGDDGTFEVDTGTTPTLTRAFAAPFTYAVRVTSASGKSATTRDTAALPESAATIAPPAVGLTRAPVTLDARGSLLPGTPAAQFSWDLDGNSTFETSTGATATVAHAFSTRGTHVVRVRVQRGGGRVDIAQASVDVRLAPPAGRRGVSIANGARAVNDRTVTLSLVWPRYATHALISNDGGFAHAKRVVVNRRVRWRLAAGSQRVPHTVYVRFEGGESGPETYQDDVVLDTTPPRVTSARWAAAKGGYKLRLRATDSASGARSYQVTTRRGKPGPSRRLSKALRVRDASVRRWVRVRDSAGNVSAWTAIARRR